MSGKQERAVRQGPVRSHRDLIAWNRAMELCEAAYRFAATLPASERFALSDQIRRAACSVPLNIAEGFGIGTRPGFRKHLRIARGSLLELQTALELAAVLGMVQPPPDLLAKADETARVLWGLLRSVTSTIESPKS